MTSTVVYIATSVMADFVAAAVDNFDVNRLNSFDGMDENVKRSNRGRKRKKHPSCTKRELAKKARYSGEGKTPSLDCNHGRAIPGQVRPAVQFCQADKLSQRSLQVRNTFFTSRCIQYTPMYLKYPIINAR